MSRPKPKHMSDDVTLQQAYEATRRAWAEAIGRPYPEKESQRPRG